MYQIWVSECAWVTLLFGSIIIIGVIICNRYYSTCSSFVYRFHLLCNPHICLVFSFTFSFLLCFYIWSTCRSNYTTCSAYGCGCLNEYIDFYCTFIFLIYDINSSLSLTLWTKRRNNYNCHSVGYVFLFFFILNNFSFLKSDCGI